MFQASAGRFLLLLSAVYLLLWSTLCIAVPTVFTLPEPPGHWKDDSPLEAYIQNQPHYKSHPVLDVAKTAKPTIKYARNNFGSVWLLDSKFPYLRKYYPGGWFAYPKPFSRSKVLTLVSQAEMTRAIGRAVKVLEFGKPFQATGKKPHDWEEVWKLEERRVPETMRSKDWLDIRSDLQIYRRLKLIDGIRKNAHAFRLLEDGRVESESRRLFPQSSQVGSQGKKLIELLPLLHKRSVVSSAQAGLDDTSTIKLTRRMDDGSPLYNGRVDRLVNIYQIMQRINYEAPRADEVLTLDGKERRYAGMVHHNGVPVFRTNAVWYSDLNHALHDHSHVWFKPNDPGIMPFTLNKQGIFGDIGGSSLQSHLDTADEARNTYGEKIMLLKYGRPFPERASSSRIVPFRLFGYKKPDWKIKVAKGRSWPLATSEVYHLRQALNEQGHIKIYDEDKRKTWGLRLLKDGTVEIKDITDLVNRIHQRALTDSQPEPEPDWTQIESHTQHVPRADPSLRMSRKDRGRYFAGDLHYKGEPIIFPGEASGAVTLAKVQRARNNYRGYWIVGHPSGKPAHLEATYIADGRVLQTSERATLLGNLGYMNQNMYGHDQDPPLHKYDDLKYGPDFPNQSKFSSYELPGAEKVRKDAPRLSSSASMADKWEMLHEKSMLVINKGKSELGYALNRAGEVSRIPSNFHLGQCELSL